MPSQMAGGINMLHRTGRHIQSNEASNILISLICSYIISPLPPLRHNSNILNIVCNQYIKYCKYTTKTLMKYGVVLAIYYILIFTIW